MIIIKYELLLLNNLFVLDSKIIWYQVFLTNDYFS